ANRILWRAVAADTFDFGGAGNSLHRPFRRDIPTDPSGSVGATPFPPGLPVSAQQTGPPESARSRAPRRTQHGGTKRCLHHARRSGRDHLTEARISLVALRIETGGVIDTRKLGVVERVVHLPAKHEETRLAFYRKFLE